MPDSTLAALTAATPAAGGLFYGTQGGVDRKFTLSAAGAAIAEAASAADQRTAMGAASTTDLGGKLDLTGGTLTGALTVNTTSGESLLLQKAGTTFLRVKDSGFLLNGAVLETLGTVYGGQILLSSSGGCYFGRRDNTNTSTESGYEAFIGSYNGSGICIRGTGSYSFGTDAGNNLHSSRYASFYYGGALNTIQMGANHASVASTQIFKAHNVTSGAGADLHLKGGAGSTSDGYVRVGTASGGLAFFGESGNTKPVGDNNQNMTNVGGVAGAVHADSEFDGGLGGNSYTIGGIVKSLKQFGLL